MLRALRRLAQAQAQAGAGTWSPSLPALPRSLLPARAPFGSVAAKTAATPPWARLPDRASEWALSRLRPNYDRLLGVRYGPRFTLINAVGVTQPRWARAMSLLLAEALTRGDPHVAWCFSSPITQVCVLVGWTGGGGGVRGTDGASGRPLAHPHSCPMHHLPQPPNQTS